MPKSKSKRNRYQPPPKPKPPPSAPWIPVVMGVFLGIGFVTIIARYALSTVMPIFDKDWLLWAGLGLVALGFLVATRWR